MKDEGGSIVRHLVDCLEFRQLTLDMISVKGVALQNVFFPGAALRLFARDTWGKDFSLPQDCVKNSFGALLHSSRRAVQYLNSNEAIPFVVNVVEP
jgi:hypothetical protein